MKTLFKNPLIRFLLICNLVLLFVFLVRPLYDRHLAEGKQRQSVVRTAERLSRGGLIGKDDYIYLATAGQRMHDTKRITDEDLAWCLKLLKTNPKPSDRNGKVPMQLMVTEYIGRYVKEFTPHQKDNLFYYFTDAMQGDGGNGGNEYIVAIGFMLQTRDVRAIPVALPFTENNNPEVKLATVELIEELRDSQKAN